MSMKERPAGGRHGLLSLCLDRCCQHALLSQALVHSNKVQPALRMLACTVLIQGALAAMLSALASLADLSVNREERLWTEGVRPPPLGSPPSLSVF